MLTWAETRHRVTVTRESNTCPHLLYLFHRRDSMSPNLRLSGGIFVSAFRSDPPTLQSYRSSLWNQLQVSFPRLRLTLPSGSSYGRNVHSRHAQQNESRHICFLRALGYRRRLLVDHGVWVRDERSDVLWAHAVASGSLWL